MHCCNHIKEAHVLAPFDSLRKGVARQIVVIKEVENLEEIWCSELQEKVRHWHKHKKSSMIVKKIRLERANIQENIYIIKYLHH